MNTTSNKRLLALDVMRGITIAGMILVNNPGSWGHAYAPLKHAQWNGLTPTDLVFPFFMFIMGISTYISLKKYNFTFSTPAALKIIKRTIVIFLIGIALNWFALLCYTHNPLPFEQIRILGVMQRLALCYGASALIALLLKHKYIPYLIVVLLVGSLFSLPVMVLPTTKRIFFPSSTAASWETLICIKTTTSTRKDFLALFLLSHTY